MELVVLVDDVIEDHDDLSRCQGVLVHRCIILVVFGFFEEGVDGFFL